MFACLDVQRMFGCVDVRMFGCSDFRMSGYPDVCMSGCPDVWIGWVWFGLVELVGMVWVGCFDARLFRMVSSCVALG